METTRLREINALQADKALASTRHQEGIAHTDNVADTVLSATSSLISYLEGHTSKTEVVNQLESISTPDVRYIVEALEVVDATLKMHENVDLSEVTGVMRELLSETRQIPKEHAEITIPEPIDYNKRFEALEGKMDAVIKAIQAQELVVHPPEVKVAAPVVKVDTDTAPIASEVTKVTKAISEMKNDTMQTQDITGLVTEPYDRVAIAYDTDEFSGSDEKQVSAVKYYKGKKLVATLSFTYKGSDVTGVKRT